MVTLFLGVWFILFSQFTFTQKLLFKYPHIFSYGICSNKGPSDERQNATVFNLKLHGKGWSKKFNNSINNPDSPPDKEIIAKISAKNPGYGLTCATFAASAITILTEADKMPQRGGVYPPGVAFAKTTFFEKLQENGVKFE